ncbi:MAG TPA: sodium:proton antiporter [Nitrososphaerales archaeon]|nr:sodium:proton antiporter [Nitrososphaerales archaeon]
MVAIQEVLTVFLGLTLLASVVSKKVKVPYPIILVLVGLALAASPPFALSGVVDAFNGLISSDLFVGLILPPLLFESIMSVRVEDFRAVYRPALLMATAGVLIATFVGGVVLWKVVGVAPLVAFLFAALISPTDVATTIEVFARVNVPARLATLVEMESVFNDASGIAIFTIVLASSSAAALQPVGAVVSFGYVLGVGVLVGLGMAWIGRQLQRLIEDSVTQIVLTLVAVYGAYEIAVLLGASGLIAVAVTGLFYGNTILLRLESKKVAEATREFWRVLAFIANAVAFFYIGVSTNIYLLATGLGAVLVAFGIVVMARISSVYPILSLNKVGGSLIPATWMNTATLGGMRGALAIALVSAIPADSRGPVATLVFGVVVLSILLQGPLLARYTRRAFGHQETLNVADEPEPKVVEDSTQPLSPSPEAQVDDAIR